MIEKKPAQLRVGDRVVYRPFVGAQEEVGQIVKAINAGMVLVQFGKGGVAKACYRHTLTLWKWELPKEEL